LSQGSLPGYQAVRCNPARRPDQTGGGERAGRPFAAERIGEPLVGLYPHQSPASALFVSWLDELLFLFGMDDLLLTYLEITSLPEGNNLPGRVALATSACATSRGLNARSP